MDSKVQDSKGAAPHESKRPGQPWKLTQVPWPRCNLLIHISESTSNVNIPLNIPHITYHTLHIVGHRHKSRRRSSLAMPLKDMLHRHGKDQSQDINNNNNPQEFTFIRTDTHTQEIITPSAINTSIANIATTGGPEESHSPTTPTTPRRKSFFRRRSHISSDNANNLSSPPRSGSEKGDKRISNLLHLDHHSRSSLSRSGSTSSVNIPADLPQIDAENVIDEQDREAQWEKRATRLVQGNPRIGGGVSPDRVSQSASSTGTGSGGAGAVNFSYLQPNQGQQRSRSRSSSGVSEPQADVSLVF